jgi:hypothetical protein
MMLHFFQDLEHLAIRVRREQQQPQLPISDQIRLELKTNDRTGLIIEQYQRVASGVHENIKKLQPGLNRLVNKLERALDHFEAMGVEFKSDLDEWDRHCREWKDKPDSLNPFHHWRRSKLPFQLCKRNPHEHSNMLTAILTRVRDIISRARELKTQYDAFARERADTLRILEVNGAQLKKSPRTLDILAPKAIAYGQQANSILRSYLDSLNQKGSWVGDLLETRVRTHHALRETIEWRDGEGMSQGDRGYWHLWSRGYEVQHQA